MVFPGPTELLTIMSGVQDEVLEPLGKFGHTEAKEKYPPLLAGQYVQLELEAIKLKSVECRIAA